METPISLTRQVLIRTTERAAELSITPDEFVELALSHYLAYQDSLHLTQDLDKILGTGDATAEAA
jgi:hypothetical protein